MKKHVNRKALAAIILVAAVTAGIAAVYLIGFNPNSPYALPTDYSKASHWLSLPGAPDKEVDIFYYYPTAWQDTDNTKPNVCSIDNPSMLKGAASAFERQATAFETAGNIYAPYYRQDNNSSVNRMQVISGTPTTDGTAAFDYYITHYNNGRPFILVGHSQGSNVLSALLASYMKEHPDVYKRMIAAYVIGYPVTAEYLAANPHLKFAEGPNDTGVIISYNTQAPDVAPGSNPVLYGEVGLVINPVNWSREEVPATTSEGLGSYMPDAKTGVFSVVPQVADAKIDKSNGVLICSTADEDALTKPPARGIYHGFDIPFYYMNLRQNAENRAEIFLGIQE